MKIMYRTSDLGLASAIHSLGYPYSDIVRLSPKKLQFIFPDDMNILAIEQAWYQGTLPVVAPSYWNSTKLLKSKIYELQTK
jgi:hypothetical protein